MQLSELVSEIQRSVDNEVYTETIIKAFINEAVLAVATGIVLPETTFRTPPLPDLFTSDTVATVAGVSASLPADYNRDVTMVLNSSNTRIKVKRSIESFMISHPDQTAGSVYECAVSGSSLYYRDIPAVSENLTVFYYKKPTTLTADADKPTAIPEALHRPLIVGYVLREIYNEIEMGMAGEKVDTKNYDKVFIDGMTRLSQILPAWM